MERQVSQRELRNADSRRREQDEAALPGHGDSLAADSSWADVPAHAC